MATPVHLDLDALRTFVLGFELGNFARAAARLGRSQSAVSTQLRRLEAQAGQSLVRRAGRGLVPTEAGRDLLADARRLLDLNDAVIERLRGSTLEGRLAVGLTQDLADALLPVVLGRFAATHPGVRIDVVVDRTGALAEGVERGEIDVALGWGAVTGGFNAELLREVPMVWIGSAASSGRPAIAAGVGNDRLELALLAPPCVFRERALAALDHSGRRWRIAVASTSVSGLIAATVAGLAITARTAISVPAGARILSSAKDDLPALPPVALTLFSREQPMRQAVAALGEALREAAGRLETAPV